MELFVIGVNHRTASLETRGCVAFAQGQAQEALKRLRIACPEQGFVLLSTCNRTELYGTLTVHGKAPLACMLIVLEGRSWESTDLLDSLYEIQGRQAVEHLFRVSAALDSMLVGEDQILGQVKTALEDAREAKATTSNLEMWIRRAVTAGKRVKAETGISKNSLSLGTLAVKAAVQKLGDLKSARALVIGSGKMGELALRNLIQAGVRDVLVTVRTKHGKGGSLSDKYPQVQTVDYDDRMRMVDSCDIVVSATQCPFYTVKKDSVAENLHSSRHRLFLDLAVPRDIDPEVASLPGCDYLDLDSLQMIAAGNHDLRMGEVAKAEAILAEELQDLDRWWMHRKAMPTLRRLQVNLKKKWKQSESLMWKRAGISDEAGSIPAKEWSELYGELATDTIETLFYRLREHSTPEETEVLYRTLDRAFRKW